jgi:hypothetical protein
LQTKLVCYKLTKATLRASLSSSLLQKCDGGNAPLDKTVPFDQRSQATLGAVNTWKQGGC